MLKTEKEAFPFEVIILGGEPFGRKDIVELLEYAFSLFGDRVGISTNGTLLSRLSEDKLARLRDIYNVNRESTTLQVSFDSIKPEINNITRGMTKETLEGLDTLEKHGINFSVGIIPTKINAHDVVETIKHLLSKYTHLKALNIEPLQPSFLTGMEGYNKLALDGETNQNITKAVYQLLGELGRGDVKIVGAVRAAVYANGDVSPCTMIRNVTLGNLFERSWKEIWSRSKTRFSGLDYSGGQCFNINKVGQPIPKEAVLS